MRILIATGAIVGLAEEIIDNTLSCLFCFNGFWNVVMDRRYAIKWLPSATAVTVDWASGSTKLGPNLPVVKRSLKIYQTVLTYSHIVIATITQTALSAFPVFVPNVVTEWHIFCDFTLTLIFCGTLLRNVVLLVSSLHDVRVLISKYLNSKYF